MADRLPEFALIAEVFAPLASHASALGLTDDVCLLRPPPGCDVVVTTDMLVEGVHFLSTDPAGSIGKKSLRVNLSDLAAKGADPAGYLLALSLPDRIDMEWIRQFAAGLSADQHLFDVSLVGGDTTRSPGPLTIAVTAMGYVPQGQLIRRRGAQPGDVVFVSGTVGDAGKGLELARPGGFPEDAAAGDLVGRYRLPTPRLKLGRALRGIATAALDVSDGLLGDLGHISEVSGVRIVVNAARIPLSRPLVALEGDSVEAVVAAATAGDDYEIAFTARSEEPALAAAAQAGVAVTRIGRVEEGTGVVLVGRDGGEIPVGRPGFTHF